MEPLQIGNERKLVLAFLAKEIERIWSGFDQARDEEPEISEDLCALLQESLPHSPSEFIKTIEDSINVLESSIAQSRPRSS